MIMTISAEDCGDAVDLKAVIRMNSKLGRNYYQTLTNLEPVSNVKDLR